MMVAIPPVSSQGVVYSGQPLQQYYYSQQTMVMQPQMQPMATQPNAPGTNTVMQPQMQPMATQPNAPGTNTNVTYTQPEYTKTAPPPYSQ